MNESIPSGPDPSRLQTCSAVFRRIREAADETGRLTFRVVTDKPVEGRPFEDLRSQKFRMGVGDDLTELALLDVLFVYEMVQHDLRHKNVPEGFRRTLIGWDDISETTARKLLNDLQESQGIEIGR